ncbi:Uncharacterised protein [Mycoplasmopsis citelli]|uniref:Uncharacterized protein n=1 Tax=Mycoplasmopsis citelli TaxID=171281 RepID=A0A449B0Q4_9BACT|nr:hypothetical protein [Mycoplasmopsis citelli]VEU74177.1 Uncharacterised protein [Mycoplasmopsis citelli]
MRIINKKLQKLKFLFLSLPIVATLVPISISAKVEDNLITEVLEFLKLRINNSEIIQDTLSINKDVYHNSSINIDYSSEFESLINYLSTQLKSFFAQERYKKQNYLFNIDYINNQEQKNFIIHISNIQKQTWKIKGQINFINKTNFFNSSNYLQAQGELNKSFSNPNYKLSQNTLKTLKKALELRIQRFNNYSYTFDNNQNLQEQKTIKVFDESVDNHFVFFAPFGFDFYSENEDEKVIVNGINLEVKNKHFTFNLASILKKDANTNLWDTNTPIELKITKFNKITGSEIVSYTEKWDVSSTIAHSDFKLLNWNPQEQYAQFNRITSFKTTIDRKPILDENGNQIPNPDYDPYIDPKTGIKSNLVWVNLPESNFYTQYLQYPKFIQDEFNNKLSNKFSIENNYFLNNYYKNNNLPLGTYFYNTDKVFFENSIYQFNAPQGIVAQSISSTSGIEFKIAQDADLVLIYKLNPNAKSLSIEPFFENGNQSYVKVLRNTEKGIENSFENFYFSANGTYLIASSKKGGQSNFLLLNLDDKNIQDTSEKAKEDLVDVINRPYIERFYDSKIGKLFSRYLTEIWKISSEKIKSLSYYDVLNYWKSFIKYSGTLQGKIKFFESNWENNFSDIINDVLELKDNTFDLTHTKFYKYNIVFLEAQQAFLDNDFKLDQAYNKFKSSHFQDLEVKQQLENLALKNDDLITEMLKNKTYMQRLNRKLFKSNNLFLQSVSFKKLSPKGDNDYYYSYEYELKFNSVFFNQQPIIKKIVLNFKSLVADYTKPDTSGISKIDQETLEIKRKFILNEPVIDQYTQNKNKNLFKETEFKSHFSREWFKNISLEEFNLYTYKLKILYQFDDIELIIEVSKGDKTFVLDPYKLKFLSDKGNIFNSLNLDLINIYPFLNNSQISIQQLIDLLILEIEDNFNPKKYYQINWDIDNLTEFSNALIKLINKQTEQINLKLISLCKEPNCTKFTKTISLVNLAPWDLKNLTKVSIIIDDNNVKDYINYTQNILKELFDTFKPKNIYQIKHLNLQDLYLKIKETLYSKQKVSQSSFELKPLKQYQSLYKNFWSVDIFNKTNNLNYLNINDIFTFDNILVDADNVKKIFKDIIEFFN